MTIWTHRFNSKIISTNLKQHNTISSWPQLDGLVRLQPKAEKLEASSSEPRSPCTWNKYHMFCPAQPWALLTSTYHHLRTFASAPTSAIGITNEHLPSSSTHLCIGAYPSHSCRQVCEALVTDAHNACTGGTRVVQFGLLKNKVRKSMCIVHKLWTVCPNLCADFEV